MAAHGCRWSILCFIVFWLYIIWVVSFVTYERLIGGNAIGAAFCRPSPGRSAPLRLFRPLIGHHELDLLLGGLARALAGRVSARLQTRESAVCLKFKIV
jgi:hypothetical protein